MLRIALIIAILAGIGATVLNVIQVKEKITALQQKLTDETAAKEKAVAAEHTAKSDKDKAEKKLKDTETELATTKDDLKKASDRADAQEKQAIALTEQLKKTKQERDDASAEIAAWKALGIPVDSIKAMIAQNDKLTRDMADLAKKAKGLSDDLKKAQNELAIYRDPNYSVPLPEGLKGKIVVVDPKWDFVVLNVGQDQGALEQGQMLVSRNGKLVGKVRIRSVDHDRSIANVMPGWKQSDIFEGDEVVVP